jgi:hypothetical protein
MRTRATSQVCWLAQVSLLCLLWLGLPTLAHAAERSLAAVLVWGTDHEKSPEPSHKPLDSALVKKLKNMPFKYKNYFEVNRRVFAINDKEYKKVEMSKLCSIEVKDKGESRINVKITGGGKLLREEKNLPLPKGESFAFSGDVKDGSAWFVIIQPEETKDPKSK